MKNLLPVGCCVISGQFDWEFRCAAAGFSPAKHSRAPRAISALRKWLVLAIVGANCSYLENKKRIFAIGARNPAALFALLSLQSFSLSNSNAPARDEMRIFGSTAAVRTMGKLWKAKSRRKKAEQEGEWL